MLHPLRAEAATAAYLFRNAVDCVCGNGGMPSEACTAMGKQSLLCSHACKLGIKA